MFWRGRARPAAPGATAIAAGSGRHDKSLEILSVQVSDG
jgi:hypothetical protein